MVNITAQLHVLYLTLPSDRLCAFDALKSACFSVESTVFADREVLKKNSFFIYFTSKTT